MEFEYIIENVESLDGIAKKLYVMRNSYQVYTFTGSLGAGKTTLIKRLIAQWGISQKDIVSPTFAYLNIYNATYDTILYHFDLYRLHDFREFFEMGFNEYLYLENSWSFIEWPRIIEPLLTHNVCSITIDFVSETQRKLVIHTMQ